MRGEALLKYRMEGKNFFVDQDALNAVLGSKRVSLPFKYNFQANRFNVFSLQEMSSRFCTKEYGDIEECIRDQVIIHIANPYKPWKYNMPWLTDIFKEYYALSPYKNEKLNLLSPLKKLYDETVEKVWRFPFEKIAKDSKVVLYGAGKAGQDMHKQIVQTQYCELVRWVDKKWSALEGDIDNPELIRETEYDYVVIAISSADIVSVVKAYLKSIGVNEDKIVC